MEELALKASKESVPGPSLPCLTSFSTTAMQTDPSSFTETTVLAATASMQTEVLIPTPSTHPTPKSLAAPSFPIPAVHAVDANMRDAPESPPNVHLPSRSSSSTFVCDFSDLHSGASHPFASLQRRHRRGPRVSRLHPSLPRSSHTPKTIVLNIYESKPKKSRVRYPDPRTFILTPCSHAPAASLIRNPHLDWGHDPRLRDLSCALTALGWVRPG
ncbi:hypothetical protein C8R45DRAFT_1103356 [Mycena sanguinolenta]|nr:hypothetical protein C8R45DRAFT_1103356 [Mycena sanguinolenta]